MVFDYVLKIGVISEITLLRLLPPILEMLTVILYVTLAVW